MKLYAGIDLHSNNNYLVLLREDQKVVYKKRLANNLDLIIGTLDSYKQDLDAIAIESTYNWYWLVDGLIESGYTPRLAHPAAMKQYDGVKNTNDQTDAHWLAEMLRLGILPEGYIYPKETRGLRELFRKRLWLIQKQTSLLLSIQSSITRNSNITLNGDKIKKLTTKELSGYLKDNNFYLAANSQLKVLNSIMDEVINLENHLSKQLKENKSLKLLKGVPGIGVILAMTILLEIGDINRFEGSGNFASYCRCVSSKRISNGKKKAENNKKNGNKYLAWAFIEAANYAIFRYPDIQKYYQRKMQRTNKIIALKTIACKLSKACYWIIKNEEEFNIGKIFI